MKSKSKAFAYLRVSGKGQLDGDGFTRQSEAINRYAKANQITISETAAKNPVSIPVDNTKFDVEWLSSCGTLHDFDLPDAYVKIEKDDPLSGEFGVVLRNQAGGVVWEIWPILAQ